MPVNKLRMYLELVYLNLRIELWQLFLYYFLLTKHSLKWFVYLILI